MHDGLCSGSAPPGAAALPPGAWGCHCSPLLRLERVCVATRAGEDLGGDFWRPWDQPPKRYRNYCEPVRLVAVRSRGALQRSREACQRLFQDHPSWARWTRWRRLRMARCALTMPRLWRRCRRNSSRFQAARLGVHQTRTHQHLQCSSLGRSLEILEDTLRRCTKIHFSGITKFTLHSFGFFSLSTEGVGAR